MRDNTDGGDDIRMKYRYLDLRRNAVRSNLELRHRMTIEVRKYLDSLGFIEVETPVLIGSTPRRCTRLRSTVTYESGTVLRTSAISADIEAVVDGFRFRPLLPDCKMFP